MRIVLTNVGQQELNNDINETTKTNMYKRYKSENKKHISYSNIKYNFKRNNNKKAIDHNISNILTEENYLNDIMKNKYDFKKNNSSLKINKSLNINTDNNIENNKNNYKIIRIMSNNSQIPKEIRELYKGNNIFEDNKINENNNYKIENENKKINKINLIDESNTLPLKDLLQTKNSKNINQNILFKQINKNEKHLINYLKSDRNIKPSFVEKINKANNDKLVRLDKICQIYFNNEKKNDILKQKMKDKIKLEYSNDSKYCRENLLNMGKDIQNCKNIFKSLSNKKENFPSYKFSNKPF